MGGAYKFDDTQASLDAYVSGPVELFGRRHELLLGGNMQRSTSEQRSAMLTPALNVPVDVFNWDPRGVPEPGTGPYVSSGQTVLKQQGVRHGPVLAGRSADAGAGRTHERVEPAGAPAATASIPSSRPMAA